MNTLRPVDMPFELLSPAGNWECAVAAVENGADAIYFGLHAGFNARARATNFTLEELPKLLNFLHARCVRGYVTLNTLVFSDELEALQNHAIAVARAGVDAVLVQDLGAARLIRRACPDLELHASTQMTLSSSDGLKVAGELGLSRSVLPRELSTDEIGKLKDDSPVGLEAFVHGALCVAYSGQCLTSESLGGRSANRGQCAQACRLPYEVICDGEDVELDDVKYLLSPQDLAADALLPELIQSGVRSFKIEGRLKTPEYVANVTRHYRQALDAAIEGAAFEVSPQRREEIELSFSRGLSRGWLGGIDHKMLVPGLSSAKKGVQIGSVKTVRGDRVVVELTRRLAVGDGVVFEGDRAAGEEQGGRIFEIMVRSAGRTKKIDEAGPDATVELGFRRDSMDFDLLTPNQLLWKTDDPKLTKRLRATFDSADPIRRVALDFKVRAVAGESFEVTAESPNGANAIYKDPDELPVARKHPITMEKLQEELGRLGGTVYQLRNVEAKIDGNPMVPLSVLGRARKALLQSMGESLEAPREIRVNENALDELRGQVVGENNGRESRPPALRVMCRHLHQVSAAIDCGIKSLYTDFQDLRENAEAVAIAKEAGVELFLATPRIEKPGETGIFKMVEKQQPDGILVRNLGGLSWFQERSFRCVADFSLNAANEISVAVLRDLGAERVTASYDLNRDQILEMLTPVVVPDIEIVIHQHMPMFHMEHCVFCAVLSPGTNKTNCGRPCDDHSVQLRDRVGMEHPLHADIGCRNTLFNAVPQSSAEITSTLITKQVANFRVELLDDSESQTRKIIRTYQDLITGDANGRDVWRRLNAANQVGVTRGTLEERRNPLTII